MITIIIIDDAIAEVTAPQLWWILANCLYDLYFMAVTNSKAFESITVILMVIRQKFGYIL